MGRNVDRQLFWNSEDHRGVAGSLIRTLLFIAFGIILNLVGYFFATQTSAPIYFDTTGTALTSLVFGPFPGAVTGVLSNVIGEYGFGAENYAAYSLVQVFLAMVWGMLPRLSRREFFVDIYNPNMSYRGLFLLLLSIGFITGLITTLTSALVSLAVEADTPNLGARVYSHVRDNSEIAALVDSIKFASMPEGIADFLRAVVLVLIMVFFAWPDKTLSLVFAYGFVVALFPLCQYRPHGLGSAFIHSNRASVLVILAVLLLLVMAALMFLSHLLPEGSTLEVTIRLGEIDARYIFTTWFWLAPLLVFLLAFVPGTKTFSPPNDLRSDIYNRVNPNADRVLPDLVQAIILLFVALYIVAIQFSGYNTADLNRNAQLFDDVQYIALLSVMQAFLSIVIRFGVREGVSHQPPNSR